MNDAIKFFESRNIPVLNRGTSEYNRATATSNLLYRFSRPDCVVQPENTDHVRTIINEARSRKLQIIIKCNGHSYAGHSTAVKGSISLDLRKMKKVNLDMRSETVTIDAGCQWGHVYQQLIQGHHDGFIINGGRCPTVGVSGFILGGGLSPFTRSFGMGSDTLMEATLVTADGRLVTVKDTDDRNTKEGKLFWALCGAGGGNFGVLVEMKLKVQKLASSEVVAGRYQWFPVDGINNELVATMNDFYTANWPTKITIDTTWICDLRRTTSLGGVRFTVTFNGTKKEYDSVIDKYFKNNELKVQLKRRVLSEKSTRFLHETLVNQWLEETERAYPSNRAYEIYSSFVFKDDRGTIQRVTALIRDLMKDFRGSFMGEQVDFLVTWIHSGGKARRKNPTDSAYFWREAIFHTYVTVEWVDKWMEKDMRDFLTKVKKALRPCSLNGEAAFINFPDRSFGRRSHERFYYGGNREELRRVKEMWDKDNFFRWRQGIQLPDTPNTRGRATLQGPTATPSTRGRAAMQGPTATPSPTTRKAEEIDEVEEDETDQLANAQWEFYDGLGFGQNEY